MTRQGRSSPSPAAPSRSLLAHPAGSRASGWTASASYTPSVPCLPIRIASAWISSARREAAVSVVKNGFPVPRGEDHDAALLEVADGAAADVRLGDLGDGDRRQHPGVGAELLERVLERAR